MEEQRKNKKFRAKRDVRIFVRPPLLGGTNSQEFKERRLSREVMQT